MRGLAIQGLAHAADSPKELQASAIPDENPTELARIQAPFGEYLSRELGLKDACIGVVDNAAMKVVPAQVQVFCTTPPFVDYVRAVRGNLDKGLQARVAAALLKLDSRRTCGSWSGTGPSDTCG